VQDLRARVLADLLFRKRLAGSLAAALGSVTSTAKLDIPRQTLESQIKSLGIEKHLF